MIKSSERKLTVILLFLIITLPILSASAKKVRGNGFISTRTEKVSSFHSIKISSNFEVELIKSNTNEVILKGEENLLEYVDVETSGELLKIGFPDYLSIRTTPGERIHITIKSTKDIDRISLSGVVELSSEDSFRSDNLELEISGASLIDDFNYKGEDLIVNISGASEISDFEVDVKNIEMNVSGNSTVELEGSSTNATFDVSGSSTVECYALSINSLDINGSGASVSEVNVTQSCYAKASGIAKISCIGNPEKIEQGSSGLARVKFR